MSVTNITLTLEGDIDYVAGTVNEVSQVFAQDTLDTTKWWAAVETAMDGNYDVYVEMYKDNVIVSTYTTTIVYSGTSFVYDRTQTDVDEAIALHNISWADMTDTQKNIFSHGMKGALNTFDIERIENDIHIIADLLGLSDTVVDYKDNLPAMPNVTYFTGLLGRLDLLRASGYVYSTTPATPSMPVNTFSKLNDIEHILHDIYTMYINNFHYYAGEGLHCGDDTNLLL